MGYRFDTDIGIILPEFINSISVQNGSNSQKASRPAPHRTWYFYERGNNIYAADNLLTSNPILIICCASCVRTDPRPLLVTSLIPSSFSKSAKYLLSVSTDRLSDSATFFLTIVLCKGNQHQQPFQFSNILFANHSAYPRLSATVC